MKASTALLMAGLSVGLAACGGGDASPPVTPPVTPPATAAVPASASQSVDGFIAYLQLLVVAVADTLEPVDVSQVTPPVSDTTEPTPIN